jgi:thioesterase domain-containing protein
VPALLAELRSRDIQVCADGDRLRCKAPADLLTAELRDQLQQCKNDILEFLRSAGALAQQQRSIVPLQPRGTRTPVFAVPGHNGDVFCYRDLVQHLGDDQPFYGLQPPGLDGHSEPLARVEDLAAYFAAQIGAFRPTGPCIIAGFCVGGMVAFELARQLLQHGAAISTLALFGADYPASYRFLPQLRRRLVYEVERVVKHGRALASASSGDRRLYIAEKLRRRKARRDTAQTAAPDSLLILRTRVEHVTMTAARRYTPGHFAGRVSLFLPNREWVRSGDAPLRWRSVARDTEEYFGPVGCDDGDLMLREPYAPAFAELFRQCREKNMAESGQTRRKAPAQRMAGVAVSQMDIVTPLP